MTPDESRAKDRALRTLRGAVKLTVHPYERDPFSGAGNCWCGRAEASVLHPHVWVPAYVDPMRCVCGKPPNHRLHTVGGLT